MSQKEAYVLYLYVYYNGFTNAAVCLLITLNLRIFIAKWPYEFN